MTHWIWKVSINRTKKQRKWQFFFKEKCKFSWWGKKEKVSNAEQADPPTSNKKRNLKAEKGEVKAKYFMWVAPCFKSCYLSIVSSYSRNSLWVTKMIYICIASNVTMFYFTTIVRKKSMWFYYPSWNDQVCFMNPNSTTIKIHFCECFLKIRWKG